MSFKLCYYTRIILNPEYIINFANKNNLKTNNYHNIVTISKNSLGFTYIQKFICFNNSTAVNLYAARTNFCNII